MNRVGVVYQDVRINYLFDEAEKANFEILLINEKINPDFEHKAVIAQEELDIYSDDATKKLDFLANKYKLDGLITLYDKAVPLVAQLNSRIGFTGIGLDVSLNIRNKYEMKKRFQEQDVSTAKFYKTESNENLDIKEIVNFFKNFPLIVKPSEGYGGDKVSLAYDESQLVHFLADIYCGEKYKTALVEEFIGGTEYIVDSFSINGRHHILSIGYKGIPIGPYFEEPFHLAGNVVSEEVRDKIDSEVSKALDALGLKSGPSHTEIKVFENKVFIIEIGARIGGEGVCHFLVKESTGINFSKIVLNWAIGNEINDISEFRPKFSQFALNYNIRVKNGGVVNKISGLSKLKNNNKILNLIILSKKGDVLKPYPNFTGYPGFINSIHNSFDEAKEFIEYLDKHIITEFN